MLNTIYKYEITPETERLELPRSFKPLHVGEQNGRLFLWIYVDTNFENEEVIVDVVGTGWEYICDGKYMQYVGTAQMSNGLVWHVFISQCSINHP